ncbi:hypothetical protein F5X68DRAFT_30465 [Plectosphaerella plurivora]|uniref:Zn(2)-C6 fungal-type domain-containing protein n=1 Tax=Plectosphaerella plurivora TaxID=936078 RepID=A0A9P9AGC7_9PEZI|nr:hypothetical protein F5X68DRAFT_30465 [Plectosphaerella plurivora]
MPPKRPSQEAFPVETGEELELAIHGAKMKLPRNPANDMNSDFSTQVKNRLSQYSRTGQACDRCKVRKIKCDALPDGCSHCIQQNLDCFVTDRVTGRTEKRGYLRELERKQEEMSDHIRALEKMLANNGIEVKPYTQKRPRNGRAPPASYDCNNPEQSVSETNGQDSWSQANGNWSSTQQDSDVAMPPRITKSTSDSGPADRHLGVGIDNGPMSSINGSQLSILGATIDVTSFDCADIDEPIPSDQGSVPLYNKSIRSFWQSVHRVNPRPTVTLPPRSEGLQYAEWYFSIMGPFLPCLHKPTMINLLNRMYDDETFQPTVPEQVVAHMVMAFIYGQKAVRNPGQGSHDDNERSNLHYHFALSNFFELTVLKTVEAVQAMALIAVYCRSFPKPGCSSIVGHHALRYAIDIGLHRSSKHPPGTTNLKNEIRKRTFWTILAIVVTVDGRLGRPMPITVDEYDIEFPEAMADELLTDEDVDTTHKGHCTIHPGLAGFRLTPLMIDMYSNIYSVRQSPNRYPDVIKYLERQLQLWREELPESYRSSSAEFPQSEMQIHPMYVRVMELDYRLSLRHPSVARTNDRELCAENSRICEETAAELLKVFKVLSDINALDTTWYSVSVYVASMFSTLVAHWERRSTATTADIKSLEKDMEDWMKVIASGASLLGSSRHIHAKLEGIVEGTIRSIEKDSIHRKSRSAPVTTEPTPTIKREPGASSATQPKVGMGYPPPAPAPAPPTLTRGRGSSSSGSSVGGHGGGISHTPQTYYSEPAPQHTTSTPYPTLAYAPPSYEPSNSYMYSAGPQPQAGGGGGGPPGPSDVQGGVNPAPQLIDFPSQAASQHVEPSSVPAADQFYWRHNAQGSHWQEWATAIAGNQEQYGANALMTMGRDLHVPATTMAPDMATQQWPMLLWGGHEQPGA